VLKKKKKKKKLYRHYKGGLYLKLFTAGHTETNPVETLVVYLCLTEWKFWARPAKMFWDKLDDGRQRFRPVFVFPFSLTAKASQ